MVFRDIVLSKTLLRCSTFNTALSYGRHAPTSAKERMRKLNAKQRRKCSVIVEATVFAEEKAVRISFSLPYHCEYGQNLSLSGSAQTLGQWDLGRCVDMTWSEGDVWRADLSFPASSSLWTGLEYKYLVRDEQGLAIAWKPGYNYQIQILESREAPIPAEVIIADTWDSSWQNIEVVLRETVSDQDGIQSQEFKALTKDAEDALMELKSVVDASRVLLNTVDVASEEALEADKTVAQASQKAQVLAKALQEAKRGQIE